MYSRLLKPHLGQSIFLFGPRGTGKSTWCKVTYPDALHFDLLESDLYQKLLASPARLQELIPPRFDGVIILDEIQRVPELLNEVHRLIENKKYKFLLTGSSARKLRKRGINLLAGRALTFHCYPLTSSELGGDFDLQHSLQFGTLPAVYNNPPSAEAYLKSYVMTYLREEVLQEGLTRNLEGFSRFLEAASFSQANELNITSVARDCGLERKVVTGYFEILEDLLIASRIPVFTKKAKRRMTAHPKFFFFDVGVYRSIRPKGPLDQPEEIDGAALETLFYQEVLALNHYHNWQYQIYFWRTSNNVEVDFVLYGPKGILAFEIKRKQRISHNDKTGLTLFLKDYPMAKAYLVCGVDRPQYEGPITLLPFEYLLRNLDKILT